MTTVQINKKSVEYEILKAMEDIAKMAKKEGKERFSYIHYNHEKKRVEATDGRAALTYEVTIDGLENDAFFSLSGNYLVQVENTSNWDFPCIDRVIPNVKEGKAVNTVKIEALNLDYKTVSIEGELCGILGFLGVRVSGIYTGLIKKIVQSFDYIALCSESPAGRPVLFHGEGLNYVVMPMVNDWSKRAIITEEARATA